MTATASLPTPMILNPPPQINSNNSTSSSGQPAKNKPLQKKKETYIEWDLQWAQAEQSIADSSITKICRTTMKALKHSMQPGEKTYDKNSKFSTSWIYDLSAENIKSTKDNLNNCHHPKDIAAQLITFSEEVHRKSNNFDTDYFNKHMHSLANNIASKAKDTFLKRIPHNENIKYFFEAQHCTMPHNCVQITSWIEEEVEETIENTDQKSIEKESSSKPNNATDPQKAGGWSFWRS